MDPRPAPSTRAVEALLGALKGSGKPFIYTSGVWVYGDTRGSMAGECRCCTRRLMSPGGRRRRVGPRIESPTACRARCCAQAWSMAGAAAASPPCSATPASMALVKCRRRREPLVDDPRDDPGRAFTSACSPSRRRRAVRGTAEDRPSRFRKIALAVTRACGIEGNIEVVPLDQARATLGPMADCLVLDQRVGSTKATRYFGWSAHQPSISMRSSRALTSLLEPDRPVLAALPPRREIE